MSLEELKILLDILNIPNAYSHFKRKVAPPFITYRVDHTENFFAGNKTYKKIPILYVELYTQTKDVELETKLEKLFDNNEIAWEIESENYIDDEEVYQIIYRI